jgi:hypothetical protein
MLCFRLLSQSSPAGPLAAAVKCLHGGQASEEVYVVDPTAFQQIPNSSFAYWSPRKLQSLGSRFLPYEPTFGRVLSGVQTGDDFRFVRASWEVYQARGSDQKWHPFLKGGSASPFYADVSMVVDWSGDGSEMKEAIVLASKGGHWSRNIRNPDAFYAAGISWALRTYFFSPSIVPKGCIPSISRYLALSPEVDCRVVIGQWRTTIVDAWSKQAMEHAVRPKYIVGIVKLIPTPVTDSAVRQNLQSNVDCAWSTKRRTDTATLTSHAFHAPALAPGRKPKPTR